MNPLGVDLRAVAPPQIHFSSASANAASLNFARPRKRTPRRSVPASQAPVRNIAHRAQRSYRFSSQKAVLRGRHFEQITVVMMPKAAVSKNQYYHHNHSPPQSPACPVMRPEYERNPCALNVPKTFFNSRIAGRYRAHIFTARGFYRERPPSTVSDATSLPG